MKQFKIKSDSKEDVQQRDNFEKCERTIEIRVGRKDKFKSEKKSIQLIFVSVVICET